MVTVAILFLLCYQRFGGLAVWRFGGLVAWWLGGLAGGRFGSVAVWRFGGSEEMNLFNEIFTNKQLTLEQNTAKLDAVQDLLLFHVTAGRCRIRLACPFRL